MPTSLLPSPAPAPNPYLCSTLPMTMVPASSSMPVPVAAPASCGSMDGCRSVPSRQARARSPRKADARRLSVHSAAVAAAASGPAGSSAAATQAEAQPPTAEASSGSGGGGAARPTSAGGDGESMEHRLTLDFLEENGYFDMPIQVRSKRRSCREAWQALQGRMQGHVARPQAAWPTRCNARPACRIRPCP